MDKDELTQELRDLIKNLEADIEAFTNTVDQIDTTMRDKGLWGDVRLAKIRIRAMQGRSVTANIKRQVEYIIGDLNQQEGDA